MSARFDDLAAVCACCAGLEHLTPAPVANRPGLDALAYRVGTHARFKQSMLAGISPSAALAALTTRQDDDFTIALVDMWATVLDVLTFYQERLANEGYLRTATERRSLLELARLIGYELRPGVAASTHLAFTLDGSEGSPEQITIAAGTRALSIPGQDELPQSFETSEDLRARPEWSSLSVRRTHAQTFTSATRVFYLAGLGSGLEPGDRALLVVSDSEQVPLTVVAVHPEDQRGRTRVTLESVPGETPPDLPTYQPPTGVTGVFSLAQQPLTGSTVTSSLYGASWSFSALTAYTAIQNWSVNALTQHVASAPPPPPPIAAGAVEPGLFALRAKTAVFGHNAPHWPSTPKDWRLPANATGTVPAAPYPNSWENTKVNQGSDGVAYPSGSDEVPDGTSIYLERAFPEILGDGWVVLQDRTDDAKPFQVKRADEESLADFGMSAKTTSLRLVATAEELEKFPRRGTTVWAQSEKLELAELPIEPPVAGDAVELAKPDFRLAPGRRVAVTGERADLEGVVDGEVAILADVLQVDGFTRLLLDKPLRFPYKRDTVSIAANVARATHGESRTEVLGSGDAARPFQRFTLRQKPLTHVSAPVPGGAASSLELRINRVLWHQAANHFELGAADRGYVLRHADDGSTTVVLGDGVHGARPPSGTENVVATYRAGIGMDGVVDRGKITLLANQPLGVRQVTNPVPSAGAEDPETRDQARHNAPLTVRTLDRVVSLRDFEDFAASFSGVGKAAARRLWDGRQWVVHLTIAGTGGAPVAPDSELMSNLREAIDGSRDPFQPFLMGSFEQLFFSLGARLKIDPDRVPEDVFAAAEQALRERFSFDARAFAERLPASQPLAVIQGVSGVEAVDLDALHYSHLAPGPAPEALLAAAPARMGADAAGRRVALAAQLLTLTPAPLVLEEME